MAAFVRTTESNQNISLLLEVARIFREMACLLKRNETERDLKNFYSHMMTFCLLVTEHAKRVEAVVSPDNAHIHQLLDRFQSLTTAHILRMLPDLPIYASHSRLWALKDYWNSIEKQSQDAKLDLIRECLDFGLSPEQRDELIEFLEKWVDEFVVLYPEDTSKWSMDDWAPQRKRSEPSYAVWAAAQALYEALVSSICSCNPTHKYRARLCLRTYQKPGLDKDFNFDMFLALEHFWQEVHIRTVRESKVRFTHDDETEQGKMKEKLKSDRKQVKRLCKPIEKIKKMSSYRLQFMVENRQLWKLQSEESMSLVDKSKPPISLEQFIKAQPPLLTGKTKRILAVLLSYAVLHLHGTQWLQSTWGSSSILFFQTTDSTIPLKPFIQLQLVQDHGCDSVNASETVNNNKDGDVDLSGSDSDSDDPDELLGRHPCSYLVTLATMLIEVYMALPFQILAKKYSVNLLGSADDKSRYLDILQVFRKCESDIPENTQFRLAVNNCLNPNLWQDADSKSLDKQTLRSVMYQEVVRPLEDELKQAFSSISIEKLDISAENLDFGKWGQTIQNQQTNGPSLLRLPVESYGCPNEFASPNQSLYIARSQQHIQLEIPALGHFAIPGHRIAQNDWRMFRDVDYASSKLFDDETRPEDISDKARKQYLDWKNKFKDVYKDFVTNHLGDSPNRPVKIAVLDTGMDWTHPDIDAREEQIKGTYNWVNNHHKQNVQDRSGHGTHTAGLLLDYAPDAELYVAKIAEKEPCGPETIAAAIIHAATVWQVDIISMSFGFPERIEGYAKLENAVQNAYVSSVLLFAAASNSGANLDRAYPARHQEVICIHSTDANGNRSKFSPTAITTDDNFATIGEAVESAWPMHLCNHETNKTFVAHKSGTSFATPIAAGIAAFLLQYSRLHLSEEEAKMLKRSSGMKAVLRRISKKREGSKERDDYDYIAPSRYSDNFFGKSESHIKDAIVDALKHS